MKGLYSVVSRSLAGPMPDFWARTLAIVSRYLNYDSRLGYHFATLNAFISEVRNDNYISSRFQGGARTRPGEAGGPISARSWPGSIFRWKSPETWSSPSWKYPRPLMEEKLDLVGRLMGCARQRDMIMTAGEQVTGT